MVRQTMPPDLIKTSLLSLFSILLLAAAFKDLVSYTIPNWVSVALALAFVPAALIAGASIASIGASLGIGLALLLIGLALFAVGWLGGGDVKLLAAASPWIGLAALPRFLVFTGLAGGVLALVLLAARSPWLRRLVAAGPPWARRLLTPGAEAPYGVAIAAGALAAFPASFLMRLSHG